LDDSVDLPESSQMVARKEAWWGGFGCTVSDSEEDVVVPGGAVSDDVDVAALPTPADPLQLQRT
jgi:hypothetical protein